MKSNKIKSSWSDLPSELIIEIAGNLTEFTDHLRFRSVCSLWRSAFHSHSHSLRLPSQLPWLALPSTFSTHFYSLSEDRVYSNPPPYVSDNSNLFGSASGWIFSVCGQYPHITCSLINPFTGASIKLPSPEPYSLLSIIEADALVWDCSDSVVVASFSTRSNLFYCRLGEAAWAPLESSWFCMVSSITLYEGRFYIVQEDTCKTVVVDDETLELITVINCLDLNYYYSIDSVKPHLFVSSGELLLLLQTTSMDSPPNSDSLFYNIRRVNLNDELVEWIEVDDIGDRALFVDNLHCFSVKVGDNGLLRRNYIYSAQVETSGTARSSLMTYSISVFDVRNNSARGEHLEGALSKFLAASSHTGFWPEVVSPPSWIVPSLS